ncbi:MAG TPA: DsbA family protein [Solirubrobacteraceae bacterium]|nr:DsbA family protein [Solirubrobacteraceae bacterium]
MDAAFYFDLASPQAYLAAERILHELPGPVEWQPVLARDLAGAPTPQASAPRASAPRAWAPQSWAPQASAQQTRAAIERQASALGLQPLRWPDRFPFDSERAMLAATYAKSIGRTVPFAQAAFRQAFAGGRDLEQLDWVLIAAAACEMHPQAVLRGLELRSVRDRLTANTSAAAAAGVREVPAVRIGRRVFAGAQALENARRAQRTAADIDDQKNEKSDRRDRADLKMEILHRPCGERRGVGKRPKGDIR